MAFTSLNLCSSNISFLSALKFYKEPIHKLPQIEVNYFVSGITYKWYIIFKD